MTTSTLKEFVDIFDSKVAAAAAIGVSAQRLQMALKRNSNVFVEHSQKEVKDCYLVNKIKWGGQKQWI